MEQMSGKIIFVNFAKCHPENCDGGICKATEACSYKLFKQEKPYEIPMADPFICRTCGDCIRACPLKAIQQASY